MTDKLVSEFRYLIAQATGSSAKFLEYMTYGYMIDNIALLITGTLHERDTRELLERCHPLGWFETLPVLCVATNIEELYNSVLIETPLAAYFKDSLSHQDLDELNIEIVRNTLYKNYLEDFYNFINTHPDFSGTPTQDVMAEILQFEADRRSINITLNSFGTELSKQERRKLYPEFGKLYPGGQSDVVPRRGCRGCCSGCQRCGRLQGILRFRGSEPRRRYGWYGRRPCRWQESGGPFLPKGDGYVKAGLHPSIHSGGSLRLDEAKGTGKSLSSHDFFLIVDHGLTHSQEIRNVTWISECIAQNQKERIGNFISVF